jgi:riboflavin synthase alpha subunit
MFTGLVQDVGTVAAREGCRLTIATALPGLALGDSVACAGCCLTVGKNISLMQDRPRKSRTNN